MGAPPVRSGLYGIQRGSANAARATVAKHNELNNNFVFAGDANLSRVPQFWVGIFNVSDIEQRIERPWVNPKFMTPGEPGRRASSKLIIVPARQGDEQVGSPFIIPDIVQLVEERPGSWQIRTFGQDGRFLAQDAINPEDPRGSWQTVRPVGAGFATNEGTNLYHQGCFWIHAPTIEELVPSEHLISMAHGRLEANYNRLIEEANNLYLQGAKGIQLIGHTHRRAANYFGLDLPWNRKYTRRIACPNCEEPLSPNAAVCTKCPAVLNWKSAIKLGLRSIEQAIAAGMIPEQAASFSGEGAKEETSAKSRKKKQD